MKAENENKAPMGKFFIYDDHLKTKLKELGSFKSPGIDKVPNFWLKKLVSLHSQYVSCFNRMVDGEEDTPLIGLLKDALRYCLFIKTE